MKFLSREELLKKQELKTVKVELTEDGGFVFVREMTGRERDAFEASLMKKVVNGKKTTYEQTLEDTRAKLAVLTVCNEKGELEFLPGDYKTLSSSMPSSMLDKIVKASQELNSISEEDVEELAKNSNADHQDSSISDCASN